MSHIRFTLILRGLFFYGSATVADLAWPARRLCGRVLAFGATQIGQPGTAVELAVGSLDLVWLEPVG